MAVSGGGVRAGQAYVELFADDSQLVRGLRQASNTLKTWGANVAKIGAGITAAGVGILTPLIASAKAFAEQGDQLDRLQKQTGLSSETLSRLGYAAKLSGADIEDVGKAAFFMNKNLGKGGKNEALDALGISFQQLQGLSTEKRFALIADALSKVGDDATQAAIGAALFGKGFYNLLPLINEGGDEIRRLMNESDRLGQTFSKEETKAADKLGDAFTSLKASIVGVGYAIGVALAPVLTPLIQQMTDAVAEVIKWTKANPTLVTGLLSIAVATISFGLAVTSLGLGIGIFGGLMALLTAGLAFLVTPLGLLVVGFTAFSAVLAGLAIRFAAIHWNEFKAGLSGLVVATKETMTGIANALKAGEVELAMGILVLGMKIAFLAGLNEMKKDWNDFVKTVFGAAAGFAAPMFDLDAAKMQIEALKTALGIANKVADAEAKKKADETTPPDWGLPHPKDLEGLRTGIAGTFAAGAERQFAFGTSDIPKQQLEELKKVNINLKDINVQFGQ